MSTINDAQFFGYPPGSVRLVRVKSRRPAWWRRLWNWIIGRPSPWHVTYEFSGQVSHP